ncbi:unnamed protein product [Aphanomyces euteiches]|uniref:Uncharacterized protein n=1 Tax=Aphanomyces euteiches TaxID=100861 RepID=A0A6G0XSR8_9STRA|nr:hypothetical protein Ae201684_001875 [Aphanomyces euteiches]KAH9157465.1 hypothetical protein AeRB84_000711 [Aphanomyces euteiches]
MPDQEETRARIYQPWNETSRWAYLDPTVENIPLNEADKDLRPPSPRLPSGDFNVFIGISSFRDGARCGFTLFTAFSRATHPNRVRIGLVDQTQGDDALCIDEYCKLAEASEWKECKYKDNVRIDKRNSAESKGPTVIRWHQQQLIRDDDEFCLQIDAHSQFLQDWDTIMVKEWLRTENEMAVLTAYPMNYNFIGPDLTRPDHYSSHLCTYNKRGAAHDVPIIGGYKLIDDSEAPQMAALWGGCLSFSKCHAERRAGNDKRMNWVFWGEEYLRSMQLWTRGYDLYSPSRHGSVVFHNWSDDKGMKKRFSDNVTQVMTKEQHDLEERMAYNRLRLALALPLVGKEADVEDMEKYYGGRVRTVEQFLKFSGISNVDPTLDSPRCEQLRWVPYAVPEIIENFLPGYKMRSANSTAASLYQDIASVYAERIDSIEEQLNELLNISKQADQKDAVSEIRHELAKLATPRPEDATASLYAKRLGSIEEQLKEMLNNSWQADNTKALQAIQHELEKLAASRPEERQQFVKMEHQLNKLGQPETPMLLPLAVVWMALITVWLAYKSRRQSYASYSELPTQ